LYTRFARAKRDDNEFAGRVLRGGGKQSCTAVTSIFEKLGRAS